MAMIQNSANLPQRPVESVSFDTCADSDGVGYSERERHFLRAWSGTQLLHDAVLYSAIHDFSQAMLFHFAGSAKSDQLVTVVMVMGTLKVQESFALALMMLNNVHQYLQPN